LIPDDDEMPSEEEAEESWQQDLYDQPPRWGVAAEASDA
jgi:hypothetical protein